MVAKEKMHDIPKMITRKSNPPPKKTRLVKTSFKDCAEGFDFAYSKTNF
jgi:hypothetical protein